MKTALLIALSLWLAARPAAAEPESGPRRKGFLFGFRVGGGSETASCGGCDPHRGGIAASIHLGAGITERLALMFDFAAIMPVDVDRDETHQVWSGLVHYRPTERLWIKGGLGRGSLAPHDQSGPALVGAGGVEIGRGSIFVFDLELRLAAVRYGDMVVANASLTFGLNWCL
jgi:hypothetical protein